MTKYYLIMTEILCSVMIDKVIRVLYRRRMVLRHVRAMQNR